MLLVVPNPNSLGKRLKGKNWVGFRDGTHISLFTPQKWLNLLGKEGFTIVKLFGDGMWDSPYLPFIPTIFQRIIFGLPPVFQVFSGMLFIPAYFGESMAVIAQKKT